MNNSLRRINEFRHYRKAILKKYGENAEVCDHVSSWEIGFNIPPNGLDRFGSWTSVWHGENLSDAIYPPIPKKATPAQNVRKESDGELFARLLREAQARN